MLNLLISLMTTTFARIQTNADMEWKFSRATHWIYYYDDRNALPVPFNLIPSVYSIIVFLKSIHKKLKEAGRKGKKRSMRSAKMLL